MKEIGEQFLNERYPDLQGSSEVESAAKRKEVRTGEKSTDKNEKVEAYLSRLEEIFDVENSKHERRVDFLKDRLHENFVIEPPDFENLDNPINKSWEGYFDHQKQIARERGHGDIKITDEMKNQMAETIIHDQTQSLDAWVDYLGSQEAPYPNWLKYFAFRSITKLSEYDKEKKEFKKRSKGTTANFPDINREALAYVLDALEKSHKKETREDTNDEQWEKLLKTANFGKLYAHAIEKITPATEEEKENIQGEWIKYEQGSDSEPLYKSLQGHGTGWCTAGEGVAKTQLAAGDFYVFYSKDKQGQPKIPRVAIRMENGEIAEVRGVNAGQELEPVMLEVAKKRLETLPGAERYEKKVHDMELLTKIEAKAKRKLEIPKLIAEQDETIGYLSVKDNLTSKEELDLKIAQLKRKELEEEKNSQLTKSDLEFLYEIYGDIEGFGSGSDPRIRELINQREKNQREDYAKIFDCNPEQVVFDRTRLKPDSVVLVGSIEENFFHIRRERVTSLPDSLRYITYDVRLHEGSIKHLPPNLTYVGHSIIIPGSNIEELPPNLSYIGGAMNIRETPINKIPPNLKFIGEQVYVNKSQNLDFSNVDVRGYIDDRQ